MNFRKLLIGVGIGTGAIAAWNYFSGLSRTSAELESITHINIHKLYEKGLVVRVDVQLKNPTKTKLKIKFPFVKLLYKDVTAGSSQVLDRDIEIPSFGEAVAEKIMIEIPLGNIFSVGGGMITSLLKGETIKLKSKTISTIDLGWKTIPYEKIEELILKK
ncbi:MAG: hypothetical protein PHP62_05375 [Candidatus Moranbacteria bacterium]|nr:hypothetical protein [Candidatus Moranbacteria bacterium]